jgi:WD40 repeat protein
MGDYPPSAIKTWDMTANEVTLAIIEPQHIFSVAWHPKIANQLASVSTAFTDVSYMETQSVFSIWNADTGELLRSWTSPLSGLSNLEWNSDGTQITANTSWDHKLGVWDSDDGREILELADVRALDLAWGSQDQLALALINAVEVIDISTGQTLSSVTTPDPITAVSWNKDFSILAYGDTEGNIEYLTLPSTASHQDETPTSRSHSTKFS